MLTRRLIRLKVMQSLYSYYSLKSLNKKKSEHIFDVDQLVKLYYFLINTLIRISNFSKDFHENNKEKFFPSILDLNPKFYFYKNEVINIFRSNNLNREIEKINEINVRLNSEYEIDRKIFLEINKNKFYEEYLKNEKNSLQNDKNFVINILNNVFLKFNFLKQILFEENVFWVDDYDFVIFFLTKKIKQIECKNSLKVNSPFKNNQDKVFFSFLFDKTIENNSLLEEIIEENSSNWDLERIASIDMILIKMGLTEILFENSLPVKVTLNEYIEISKLYSTKKSSNFINGILDMIANKHRNRFKNEKG